MKKTNKISKQTDQYQQDQRHSTSINALDTLSPRADIMDDATHPYFWWDDQTNDGNAIGLSE